MAENITIYPIKLLPYAKEARFILVESRNLEQNIIDAQDISRLEELQSICNDIITRTENLRDQLILKREKWEESVQIMVNVYIDFYNEAIANAHVGLELIKQRFEECNEKE